MAEGAVAHAQVFGRYAAVTMLSLKLCVAAVVAIVFIPISWQQQSLTGVPYKLGSAVPVVPSANDVWTWVSNDSVAQGRQPIAIAGVVPNLYVNQWATITDIRIWRFNPNSGDPRYWWLRDGTTGQILYCGVFEAQGAASNQSAGERVHLATPLVLDHGSANPPTIEYGSVVGTHEPAATIAYMCSIVGRYVYNT